MAKFIIELNEKQMANLALATELLSRLLLHQFHFISDLFLFKKDIPVESFLEFKEKLEQLKPFVSDLPQNAYHGIHSLKTDERAKISWDIHQVVRKALWDNKHDNNDRGGLLYPVDSDDPLKTSNEPLPIVTLIDS